MNAWQGQQEHKRRSTVPQHFAREKATGYIRCVASLGFLLLKFLAFRKHENDIYEEGFPLYHVERIIQELQRPFDDGAHIIYVNGANRDDRPLGRLMQDFFCERPEQMNYKELAKKADYFKAEAEGVHIMCELMEKFGEKKLEEGREVGRVEGHREGMIDMACSPLTLNVPVEVIEKSSGLMREEILAL